MRPPPRSKDCAVWTVLDAGDVDDATCAVVCLDLFQILYRRSALDASDPP
jgi:hypothetical protein